jgi:hypothetical protein
MRFASESGGGGSEFTLGASYVCDLNGTTLNDALDRARAGEQAFGSGARAVVTSRSFGGPAIQFNSQVNIRFSFPSAADFGAGMDSIQQNTPPPNAMTCGRASMWAQYLIHSQNN